jgi:hypothetical protein
VAVSVALSLVGVRWSTQVRGEFFCPGCGGDRNYRRQTGRRWLRLLGVPLLPLGDAGSSLQCATCHERYGLDALERPTCTALLAMLRNAHWAVALALLAAGGSAAPTARRVALTTLREAGYEELDEARLLEMLAQLTDDSPLDDVYGCGSALAVELHTALEPLTPHLLAPGLERLLLQGAWIALADGPYRPREREALAAVGRVLGLAEARTQALLLAAEHTPHQ